MNAKDHALFIAQGDGRFSGPGLETRCALGKGGLVAAADKREGDGASPAGVWPLRRVFWRADRLARPETRLETVPLRPHDGWCDAPDHPLYNRPVTRPFPASHEALWREDAVYDLIVELGHNDAPPVPGLGSAVFMHLAKSDYAPTEGCIALSEADLRTVLKKARSGAAVEIAA